jgi:cell division protein ZapA
MHDDFPTSSDVTLSIGGRSYKLACAPGEEEHIAALGRAIDGKLKALPGLPRQSEAQTLLYATLLLADELHERTAACSCADPRADAELLATPLERLAEKLESIAAELEHGRANT